MLQIVFIGKALCLYNEHATLKEVTREAEDIFSVAGEKIRRFDISYQDIKKSRSYLYRADRFSRYENCTFDEAKGFSFQSYKNKTHELDAYWEIGRCEDYRIIRGLWNYNEEKGTENLLDQIKKIRWKLENIMCMQSLSFAMMDIRKVPIWFLIGMGNCSNTDFDNLLAFTLFDYWHRETPLPYLFPYTYSKDFPENWHYGTEEKQTLIFENLLTSEFADYEKDKDWVHYYLQMREAGLVRILEEHHSAKGYKSPKPIL